MKKLLLVLVEVLNLEHSIPRGIIIRLTTDCASAVDVLGPITNAKTRTYVFKVHSFRFAEKRGLRSISFCSGIYAPDYLLHFLSSERQLVERGRFKSVPGASVRYRRLV